MVTKIIQTCVVLHNLWQTRCGHKIFQPKQLQLEVEGILQGNDHPCPWLNVTEATLPQRSVLADYFHEGAASWQMNRI